MSYRLVQQLSAVREEFEAARGAGQYVERRWPEASLAPELDGVHLSHLRRAVDRLEDTYVIRLFAQFEGLIVYHLTTTRRRQRAPATAEALINRVALIERLPNGVREGAHRVRAYRNAVAHPRSAPTAAISFPEAVSALNQFLAPLPDAP